LRECQLLKKDSAPRIYLSPPRTIPNDTFSVTFIEKPHFKDCNVTSQILDTVIKQQLHFCITCLSNGVARIHGYAHYFKLQISWPFPDILLTSDEFFGQLPSALRSRKLYW